jgi:hypothetical protein
LQSSCDREDHEGPFDGPDSALGRGDRRINHAVRMAVLSAMPVIAPVVMDVGFTFRLGDSKLDKRGAKHSILKGILL